MNDALLWLDAPLCHTLAEKVARAAARYHQKYGCAPDLCYVPTGTPGVPCQVGPVRVEARRFVLAGHLQVGMEEKTK